MDLPVTIDDNLYTPIIVDEMFSFFSDVIIILYADLNLLKNSDN